MNALDRAIDGAALAPLDNEQKRSLILLARRAYRRYETATPEDERRSFEDWRRREQKIAVERDSLRASTNEDFRYLKAHFLRLCGDAVAADRLATSARLEPRQWARKKLEKECAAAADVIARPVEYVSSIARARFKVPDLDALAEKQLWILVFDVRRNAQRRRKTAAGEKA